jgi:MFS family permease
MQIVALGWVALELSHSGFMLGLVNSVPIFAGLVSGPLGGLVADRFPARRILVVTNAVQGLVAAVLGILAASHVLAVWHLILGALVVGTMSSISVPTTQVFVGEIASDSHLPQAINVNNAITVLSAVAGYILVGPTISWLGTAGVISVNALTYLVVIGTLSLIRRSELHPRQAAENAGAHLWTAIAFLRSQLDLKVFLVITAVVSLFSANLPTLVLLMSGGSGARTYGILLTALTVGSTVGAVALVRVKSTLRTVIVASLVLGLLEAAVPLATSRVALIAVLFLIGVAVLLLQTRLLTMVQLRTKPEFRGRVLAIFMTVFRAFDLVGTMMAGWLSHLDGPRALIGAEGLTSAGILVAICVVLVATRALSISRTGRGFDFVLGHEVLPLWYPEALPDEAPEPGAVIHHQPNYDYVEALGSSLLNMSVMRTGYLDPTSVERLIPMRRGHVQGPAIRLAAPGVGAEPVEAAEAAQAADAVEAVEPAKAAEAVQADVPQQGQDRQAARFYGR